MASDSLRQVGKYLRKTGKNADLALKRNFNQLNRRDRARDTISAVNVFTMSIQTEDGSPVTIDINFNKPPPDDCSSNCISTACTDFALVAGGHSITVNPYEVGTVKVYTGGVALDSSQWYEENPGAGQVYVQVQDTSHVVVVCYTYIVC